MISKIRGWFTNKYEPVKTTFFVFEHLNSKRLIKDMELVKIGEERGGNDDPPSDSNLYDDIEGKIISFINEKRDKDYGIFRDQIQTYAERLGALRLDSISSTMDIAARNAVAEFETSVRKGIDELHLLKESVSQISREISDFKRDNKIYRMAHYPESRILNFSIILIVVILETLLNGLLLSRGLETGIIGGIAMAFVIAAVNIGAGAMVGKYFYPLLYHIDQKRKIIGGTVTIFYIAFIIFLNILVAHYRNALGGAFPENAAVEALTTFSGSPFSINDFNSLVLMLMGIAFSLIASIDVFAMDDKYPGYGALDKKYRLINDNYAVEKNQYIGELQEIKDDALMVIEERGRDISRRNSEFKSILENKESLVSYFRSHLGHLENVGNELLGAYRQANRLKRNTSPPARFSERWKISDISDLVGGNARDQNREAAEESIKKAIQKRDWSMQEIQRAYRSSLIKYQQLGDIQAEEEEGTNGEE